MVLAKRHLESPRLTFDLLCPSPGPGPRLWDDSARQTELDGREDYRSGGHEGPEDRRAMPGMENRETGHGRPPGTLRLLRLRDALMLNVVAHQRNRPHASVNRALLRYRSWQYAGMA